MIHEYIIKVDEDKKDIMGNCPLVDKPRELVRCKDCKNQDPDRFNDGSNRYVCRKGHGWKPDDWYCADGKRR